MKLNKGPVIIYWGGGGEGGPLYLGGGSLFFELHLGKGHLKKNIIEGRATIF